MSKNSDVESVERYEQSNEKSPEPAPSAQAAGRRYPLRERMQTRSWWRATVMREDKPACHATQTDCARTASCHTSQVSESLSDMPTLKEALKRQDRSGRLHKPSSGLLFWIRSKTTIGVKIKAAVDTQQWLWAQTAQVCDLCKESSGCC